jgi:hypothetical protein
MVATWSQSSGPHLRLQGRGSRVDGTFPRRSARGWGWGARAVWRACQRGAGCPITSRTPRACVGGSVQKKEEEGATGLADARTPPGSEREEEEGLLG